MKKLVNSLLRKFELEIRRIPEIRKVEISNSLQKKRDILFNKYLQYMVLNDFTETDINIINSLSDFTMTGPERMWSLLRSIEYIVSQNIPGDIVECGVWKGGSMMLIAQKILEMGIADKHLYLYDTYEGMSEPSSLDISYDNKKANNLLNEEINNKKDGNNIWCFSTIEEVKENIYSTGYDPKKIHLIKGKVEETLPKFLPKNGISLLRLDTDWYESTKHELKYLYPLLVKKGVLFIDDYGQWLGQRKAVDEYVLENNLTLFLNRIDFSSRLSIKI